jgi:hypothetical protein
MLTATGADILKINRSTTAITRHHSLSLSYTSIIHILSVFARKKKRKKFFEENFTSVNLAARLAQDLLCLPFWQFLRDFCHFGSLAGYSPSCQPAGSAGTPLLEGVAANPVDATNPLPRIGGAVSLANQTKLTCQLPPI